MKSLLVTLAAQVSVKVSENSINCYVGFEILMTVNMKMWHCIVCWIDTNISDEPSTSIFSVEE